MWTRWSFIWWFFFCLVRLFPLHRWRFSEKQDSGDLVAKWHGCFMKTILLPLIFVCSVELDWQKLWYTQCYFVMLNVVWRSIETERYINVKCWIYRCGSSGECHLIINTVSSVCRAHPLDPPQTHSSCFNSFPFFLKKICYSASTINIKHAFRTKTACIQRTEKNPKVLPFLKDIALCSYGMTKHMLSMFCGGKRKITLEEAIVSIQQKFLMNYSLLYNCVSNYVSCCILCKRNWKYKSCFGFQNLFTNKMC